MRNKKQASPNVIRRSSHTSVRIGNTVRDTGSGVAIQVGGRHYAYMREARCKVCNSVLREEAERWVSKGFSYASTMRKLQSQQDQLVKGEQFSYEALRRHAKNHMAPSQAVMATLSEAWQERLGLDVAGQETVISHLGVIDAVLHEGASRIANGTADVKVSDTLAAAKLLLEYEGKLTPQQDVGTFFSTLQAYLDVTKSFLSSEQFSAFSAAIESHPAIQQMIAEIPAEVVEVREVDEWSDDDEFE